ncbi:hypothetical protein G9A89_017075 [Geosiphon pyriformis]|nr:hypothetical protein G9A89_017075 [Geosiphon pyriformis]
MQQQYQQPLPIQPYQTPPTQQYQVPARRLVQHNQFTPQNQLQKESDFQQTALSESEVAAPSLNSSNHTIPPAQIAQNANLSDIFPFEFEANESPFLLSNAAINEQKAITAMYTEATVEGKPIRLILDSGSAGSIITYQLMQQLKQNVDRPAQTVIVIANGIKKTPVGEIDDFLFTIDGITIPVKASTTIKKRDQKPPVTFGALPRKQHSKNKFKVVITPDTTTLEYYQSIYTHCKQRFNISDEIKVVKKSVYQYIENCINNYFFGNYNISEVRSNFYNNLAHYSQLRTEDLNSETLATYFQELNFNIIKYCEETYPVQSQYSIDFESKTETSNKGKHKLKQYSKTTPNTLISPKTTAKHLQTPEQKTTENQSEHSETAANEENNSEIIEEESIDSENKEDKMTAYITKIPEFNGENIETNPQEWLDQNAVRILRTIPYFLKGTAEEWFENLATPFNDWNAFKAAFLEQFTNNNTSITLRNWFHNIKQESSESVMTYIGKFNKLLRQIRQLKTNDYYFDAQILDQFITGLKDKLIKKVRPHAPDNLNSAIQHAKRYEMAMEETNRTKLVNLVIGETSSAAEEKIDQLAKKVKNYFTNQQQQQPQRYQPPQRRNQNNFVPLSNKQP